MTRRYTIAVTAEQAHIISQACDLLARLGIGQWHASGRCKACRDSPARRIKFRLQTQKRRSDDGHFVAAMLPRRQQPRQRCGRLWLQNAGEPCATGLNHTLA